MNQVEYTPSGVEMVWQRTAARYSPIPQETGGLEGSQNLSGIAVAPLSELLDEFKCHPNHMNHLRQQYINLFAELAESNILSDILSQIHGCKGSFPKLSPNLAEKIRESNYALS